MELVQKVTGHKTADIVLKHYFQPGREAFRQALQSAMPELLTNGQKSPKDEILELLRKSTASQLRGLAPQAPEATVRQIATVSCGNVRQALLDTDAGMLNQPELLAA